MYRRPIACLAAIVAFLLAPLASAADQGGAGYYAGLRMIGSVADVNDSTGSGLGGTLLINNDSDLTAGAGFHVGYRWKSMPLRTDLELSYRFRFDYDLRDQGTTQVGYENNLATIGLLFNAVYEFRNKSCWTPYVGGTFGWAGNRSSTTRTNLTTAATEDLDNTANNFAWGGTVGLVWQFAKRWDVDFGYRYINLGEVDTGQFATGERITADEYIAHDVLISANYRF